MGRTPAAAPLPLPRRLLKRPGASWKRRGAWLALAALFVYAVYLEKTKAPLRTSAGRRRLPGPRENQGWQEVLEGLVQQRQINVAVITGSADADSGEAPAERWSHLPSADRTAALEHGMEQMLADPMVLRLGGDESPDAGRDILAKIAPELLVTAEGDDALAVPQLLQALTEGRENDGVLPDVPELPPGATPAVVAEQQVLVLRRALRSALLSQYLRHVLLPQPADTPAPTAEL